MSRASFFCSPSRRLAMQRSGPSRAAVLSREQYRLRKHVAPLSRTTLDLAADRRTRRWRRDACRCTISRNNVDDARVPACTICPTGSPLNPDGYRDGSRTWFRVAARKIVQRRRQTRIYACFMKQSLGRSYAMRERRREVSGTHSIFVSLCPISCCTTWSL